MKREDCIFVDLVDDDDFKAFRVLDGTAAAAADTEDDNH